MGFFFTSPKNTLSQTEIDHALSQLGILEAKDKQEIRRRLKRKKGGGISKKDIIEVTRDLKKDTTDSVNTAEAESARRQLLKELEKDDN